MNIHENMLRQIIMKTIQGVKSGAKKVVGAIANAPPEQVHGPYGMKPGINPPDAPVSGSSPSPAPKPNLKGSVGPISRFENRR